MFRSAADGAFAEIEERKKLGKNILRFGIQFLDDALRGIMEDDLVLIGAPSGVGKTQLCCNIALQNLADGKRVHYIALEAGRFEIERRLKFQILSNMYWSTDNRPQLAKRLTFDRWITGEFLDSLLEFELEAAKRFEANFKNLYLFYKNEKFDVNDLLENVAVNSTLTDLIIVDHVHYFDFDDDNENRAIKEIAKASRKLALEHGKPIILVAHLRKRDRFNLEYAAGLDEFHGSSDLTKIATKVITVGPGSFTANGNYETFFRTPKNRNNGGVTRFLGRLIYDQAKNAYEEKYRIGLAGQTRDREFEDLAGGLHPEWAVHSTVNGSNAHSNASGQSKASTYKRGTEGFKPLRPYSDDE